MNFLKIVYGLLKGIYNNIKVLNVLCAIFYIFLFRSIYENYLVPIMGYMHYEANFTSTKEILLCDLFLIVPILFYKASIKISDFFSIMVYIFMYIPSLISLQYFFGCARYLGFIIAFMIAMIFFFKASNSPISDMTNTKDIGKIDIRYVILFGFFCALTLLVIFRNNLHFVSFSKVYDLREDNTEISKGFALAGYFQMWCQGIFSPLLITIGLYKKNIKLVLLGFFMSLLIYTAMGLKSSIITPFIVIGFYFFMNKFMKDSLKNFFPLFTGLIALIYYSSFFFESPIAQMAYAVIFMRSIGISAQLAPCYITVFDNYPHTYYTHISIIGKIFGGYPFDNPSMGNAVWELYTGEDEMNANANFWLTDGTAAAGVPGVLLISIIFYILLIYLNKLSNAHNQAIVFSMLIPIIMTFTNVSLFTTFLSGGLFLAMIVLKYCSFDVDNSSTPVEKVDELGTTE